METKSGKTNEVWIEPQLVRCTYCGYVGTAQEFVAKDMEDDKCPKCGHNEPVYEV